jgi:hypothetical protein
MLNQNTIEIGFANDNINPVNKELFSILEITLLEVECSSITTQS